MTQNLEQLIEETKESYYEYVLKIENGCSVIVEAFKEQDINSALKGIVQLSEGLTWLIEAEELLEVHSYKIESPISQVSPLFSKINNAIEVNNFDEVNKLLEDDLKPLFKNSVEWKFEKVIS